MTSVFLIGGGRDDAAIRATHRPFVEAAGDGPIVALVLDEGRDTDPSRWLRALESSGARDVTPVIVSPQRPALAHDTAGAAGVFVAGGWTPGYHDALVTAGTDWLRPHVPYAGFSAGAAIAAADAIVGGWRLDGVAVCAEEAGEDLAEVMTRPGLGLVPFAVDVHATQWGTLTRLVHAVRAGLAGEGWAIDEGVALCVLDGAVRVAGAGSAYRVSSAGDRVTVEVVRGAQVGPLAG